MRKFWDTYFESCGPAFQPLGPDHPRLFNPRPTTQRPYSQTLHPDPPIQLPTMCLTLPVALPTPLPTNLPMVYQEVNL